MSRKKYLLEIFFLVFLCCKIGTVSVNAAWEKEGAGWRYSENASYKKSSWFQEADGKWYYFDENGYMKTGWFQDKNGKWYYFDPSGFMKTGWIQDTTGKYYYLYSNGEMACNTLIDGIYQLGPDGAWINENKENSNLQQAQSDAAAAIKNQNIASYTAGTGSVYGSELTQAELDEVAEATAEFISQLTSNVSDLDTVERVLMAHNYLAAYYSPAQADEKNADTAWAALVGHKAHGAGYARAMKALCDAMGVNCYYVSSADNQYQWNLVEVEGKWYIVDVQVDASYFCFDCFLCGEEFYQRLYSELSYEKANYPVCSKKGYEILSYYGKHPQSSRTAFLISASSSYRYPDASSTEEKNQQALVIAQKIASEITGETDLEKVQKAAQIVSTYCAYAGYTMEGKDYRTAYGVFIKGEYSCAGATRALGMLLNCMGYSYEHVNENQYTHQWCVLTMDGQIRYADGQVGWAGYGKHPVAD